MLKKAKIFIPLIVIAILLLPKPAHAFFLEDVFAFFDSAMSGIEEAAGPIAAFTIKAAAVYAVGIIALGSSIQILQWEINNPQWLSVQHNQMVTAGWSFTSGLANMFLILIFIIIAFSLILKLENFQIKKILPRLIIVALLLNFSMVFIGMFIDVSNIFYNTFLHGNENVLSQAFASITGGIANVITSLVIMIVAWGGLFFIPFTAPFAQLALVLGVGAFLLPNIAIWTFQLVCAFLLSGVLFLYIFLFAARVFVIQILAIVAPLAFLCLILPQTEKYWQAWLKNLIQWSLLGIVLLFLLMLGLGLTNSLMPAGLGSIQGSSVPGLAWASVKDYFVYYFFLFIYLVIVAAVAKRAIPTAAQMIMTQVGSYAKMAWGMGLKPLGKAVWGQTQRAAARSEAMQRWAQRQALAERPTGLGRVALPIWAMRKGLGAALGPGSVEQQKRKIDEGEKKIAGKGAAAQMSAFRGAMNNEQRIAALSAIVKDKNSDEAIGLGLRNDEIEPLFGVARRYGKESTIRAAFPNLAAIPANLPPGAPGTGVPATPGGTPTPVPSGLTPAQAQAQYVFDRIKAADYENMAKSSVLGDSALNIPRNDEFLEALLRRDTVEHIVAFNKRFKIDGTLALEQRLSDMTRTHNNLPAGSPVTRQQIYDYLRDLNPRLHRYFTTGAGQGLINI